MSVGMYKPPQGKIQSPWNVCSLCAALSFFILLAAHSATAQLYYYYIYIDTADICIELLFFTGNTLVGSDSGCKENVDAERKAIAEFPQE